MQDNNHLKKFLFQFATQTKQIKTLRNQAINRILKVDEKGIYVETESSRKKFESGTEPNPYRIVKSDWVTGSFDDLVKLGEISDQNLVDYGRRHSFLIAFLASLPFIEENQAINDVGIRLKQFTTADLPGQFNQAMSFISDEKNKVKEKILHTPFFEMVFEMLKYMTSIRVKDKRETLLEAMYITTTSSTTGTPIKESVAQKKLGDTLNWLKQLGIIDEELKPTERMDPEYEKFINNPLHQFYIRLRHKRANEIKELFKNPDQLTLNQFNEGVWRLGHALTDNGKLDVFKLMKSYDEEVLQDLMDKEKSGQLRYVGNACWGSATRIFGSQLRLSDGEKLDLIRKAVSVLNQSELSPFEKYNQIIAIPGFGDNITTGLLMLYHPNEFAIYNTPSKSAMNDLGFDTSNLTVFQKGINRLKEDLGANDYIELDWYLYCQKLNGEQYNHSIKYWWVNQGQSAKAETEGGFLWAPKQSKTGTPLSHHTDLVKANPGDIVFAYSSTAIRSICVVEQRAESNSKPTSLAEHGWDQDGNLLRVRYYQLDNTILKSEIPEEWRLEEQGPFDRNGNVKQGYFYLTSNQFAKKVFEKFEDRIPHEILDMRANIKSVEKDSLETERMKFISDQDLIEHVYSYIKNKGFYYSKKSIQNLYLCLKTKPFVILSGISGTGKTQIVKLFAESLGATEQNGQFKLIPVRPDWSDGSDLIGYEDIKGEFKPGPLTLVLQEANRPENQQKPYFILLDEMNLARVEYYFSDLLSVMESREKRNGEFFSTPVVDRVEVGKLMVRNNVYFIGTVNMDETTHPFSPKVLDRANTIEYNDVALNHFDFLIDQEELQSFAINNEQLAGEFIKLKDAFSEHEGLIREITDWLVEINTILEQTKSHFGYRVRDEICFYMIYNELGELMPKEEAFDFQLNQKILPRLTGNDVKTEQVLKDLFKFCTNHAWEDGLVINEKEVRFPKSAEKLDHMINKIRYDGFTSFWI